MEVSVLFFVVVCSLHDIEYFHTGLFQPYRDPGIYEVDTGLEIPGRQLALFAYINDDKL